MELIVALLVAGAIACPIVLARCAYRALCIVVVASDN